MIKSLEAEHTDTPMFFKKAWDILENEIIQNQSVDGIDTVSGATYSSKGIINAMKDILKQALLDFDGTLIVVSHDRDFLDGLVTKVYEFGNQKVTEHLCGIYEFLEKKKMDSLQELEKK